MGIIYHAEEFVSAQAVVDFSKKEKKEKEKKSSITFLCFKFLLILYPQTLLYLFYQLI